mgnify:CR=1 FL=1
MAKVLITDGVHPSIIREIEHMGYEVTYKPKMAYDQLPSIIHDYEGIIINSKIIMNRQMIDLAKKLHFIGRLGSGLDIIDLNYAKEKEIAVLSAPEGNCNAVGEHALGMLLSLTNSLNRADSEVRELKWNREKNRGFELEGKKIGIIGYGHTGPSFAEKLQGFRCKIYVYDKYRTQFSDAKRSIIETSLEDIQEKCDIISIHLPLTEETRYFVNADFIEKCKKKPILINTSRGKIVRIKDLLKALKNRKISGACLDVFENEPNVPEALRKMENVTLLPHIGSATIEVRTAMGMLAADNLDAFFAGHALPHPVVQPKR